MGEFDDLLASVKPIENVPTESFNDLLQSVPAQEQPASVESFDDLLQSVKPQIVPPAPELLAARGLLENQLSGFKSQLYPNTTPTLSRVAPISTPAVAAIPENPPPSPAVPQGSSIVGSFARGAAESAIPFLGGVAGSKPGAITGMKLGAKVPGAIPKAIATLGGGLLGMLGGSWLASKGQDIALDKLVSPETANAIRLQSQADREKHPFARAVGEMIPQALAFKPSPSNVKKAINTVRLLRDAGNKELFFAQNPEALGNLVNVVFGSGTALAQEIVGLAGQGKVNPTDIGVAAMRVLAGAFLNKETPIGKYLNGNVKLNTEQKTFLKEQQDLMGMTRIKASEMPTTKVGLTEAGLPKSEVLAMRQEDQNAINKLTEAVFADNKKTQPIKPT